VKLNQPGVVFIDVAKSTLMPIRMASLGELLGWSAACCLRRMCLSSSINSSQPVGLIDDHNRSRADVTPSSASPWHGLENAIGTRLAPVRPRARLSGLDQFVARMVLSPTTSAAGRMLSHELRSRHLPRGSSAVVRSGLVTAAAPEELADVCDSETNRPRYAKSSREAAAVDRRGQTFAANQQAATNQSSSPSEAMRIGIKVDFATSIKTTPA